MHHYIYGYSGGYDGWWPLFTWWAALPIGISIILFFLAILFLVWTLYWKIAGVWHAARDGKKWWFIALLFLNTASILEILYIFVFREKAKKFNWKKPFN